MTEELYEKAIKLTKELGKYSPYELQLRLKCGRVMANKLILRMEEESTL